MKKLIAESSLNYIYKYKEHLSILKIDHSNSFTISSFLCEYII